MVTQATIPVMDFSLPIDTFNLRGTGVSSIDSTPIGAITPSTGRFTTLDVTTGLNLGSGVTITGLPAPVKNASIGLVVQPYEIINSIDGVPYINTNVAAVTLATGTGTAADLITDGLTTLGSYVKLIVPAAKTSNAIISGGMVVATDTGVIYFNKTNANITLTGTTAATLVANGLTLMGSHLTTDFVNEALVGVPVVANDVVVSSDGHLMINKTLASISPATGTATEANLLVDGFTSLGSSISSTNVTLAAVGTIVPTDTIVLSSDGQLMVNHSGASITPVTGITAANLITDGLSSLGALISGNFVKSAKIGVSVAISDIVVSSDGNLMINTSPSAITPSTGTATSANLITDGFVTLSSTLGGAAGATITPAVIGTVVPVNGYVVSSDGKLMYNQSTLSVTPTAATAAGLIADGLVDISTMLSQSTTTQRGTVKLASNGVTLTGTDTLTSVTPASLRRNSTILGGACGATAPLTPGTGDWWLDTTVPLAPVLKRYLGGIFVNDLISGNGDVYVCGDGSIYGKTGGVWVAPAGGGGGAIITPAAIGTAVAINGIVTSSDGVPMTNNSGASITPTTGTATAANLLTDGLVSFSSAFGFPTQPNYDVYTNEAITNSSALLYIPSFIPLTTTGAGVYESFGSVIVGGGNVALSSTFGTVVAGGTIRVSSAILNGPAGTGNTHISLKIWYF